MADMDKCELFIVMVVARRTLGFQKEWDRISFSQFQKDTGLNRNSTEKGIQSAIERGLIHRRQMLNSFEYRLNDPKNGTKNVPISKGFGTETVLKNGTENELILENGTKNEPKSVQKMYTQKKKEIHPTDVAEQPQDSPTQSLVEQFHKLMEELKTAKNRSAKLREIYILCYGEANAPDYGYLGKVAAQVGGAGYLAQRLWELAARPPNGDVLAYITAEHKGKAARRNGKATIGDNAEIWHDISKQDIPDYMKELMA
jgi:hypothetical protein